MRDRFSSIYDNMYLTKKEAYMAGYSLAQKEMQEKLDAAIQIIKDLNPSCAHFDEMSAQYRAVSFLKARGE